MFKVFFILIILHGFNCCSMDDDKIWVTNEELILKNTIGRIFSEIIISMDEECYKVNEKNKCEEICENKLKLIEQFVKSGKKESKISTLATIIFQNNPLNTRYVMLSLEILKNYSKMVKINSKFQICQKLCEYKFDNLKLEKKKCKHFCECNYKKEETIRLLLMDDLIDKTEICLYLMDIFNADPDYCYE